MNIVENMNPWLVTEFLQHTLDAKRVQVRKTLHPSGKCELAQRLDSTMQKTYVQ